MKLPFTVFLHKIIMKKHFIIAFIAISFGCMRSFAQQQEQVKRDDMEQKIADQRQLALSNMRFKQDKTAMKMRKKQRKMDRHQRLADRQTGKE